MLPDEPRNAIARRARLLADVLSGSLPKTVRAERPYCFATIGPLLLTRIAGQGRSVATLVEAGHEIDARIVMRSALEHLTLLAWLAIEPSELPSAVRDSRQWRARTRDENTRWWEADQLRREQRLLEKQEAQVGGLLDSEARSGIPAMKPLLEEQPASIGPRGVREMGEEADVAWGGRLPGWPGLEPSGKLVPFTMQWMYWTLYAIGSGSTHPGLGQLQAAFLTPVSHDPRVAPLVGERQAKTVDPFSSITVYLLLYAAGIAQHIYGGEILDEALHIVDRFDVVRGPDVLLRSVAELLGGLEGRRFGLTGGIPISVESRDGCTSVVLIEADGWVRLVHGPGPLWTWDGEHGPTITVTRAQFDEAPAARVRILRERLDAAVWATQAERWPTPTS